MFLGIFSFLLCSAHTFVDIAAAAPVYCRRIIQPAYCTLVYIWKKFSAEARVAQAPACQEMLQQKGVLWALQ